MLLATLILAASWQPPSGGDAGTIVFRGEVSAHVSMEMGESGGEIVAVFREHFVPWEAVTLRAVVDAGDTRLVGFYPREELIAVRWDEDTPTIAVAAR